MFSKFEVLTSWKLSWGLSVLLFGFSDGHIFFDFSNYCPNVFHRTGGATIPAFNFEMYFLQLFILPILPLFY